MALILYSRLKSFVTFVFGNYLVKLAPVQKRYQLSKNVFDVIHRVIGLETLI